jgi:uncharacterized membrane protein
MDPRERDIIELRRERPEEAEIRYASPPPSRRPQPGLLSKITTIVLGALILLALLAFFLYVVLPILVIALLLAFLRRALGPPRR